MSPTRPNGVQRFNYYEKVTIERMEMAFLQDVFLRFRGRFAAWEEKPEPGQTCVGALNEAIEHVVDETFPRTRAIPGYVKRLKGPVATTFRYVDELAEGIPALFPCSRASFNNDPRVRAFFVNPDHMREVFSQSQEIRELFDAHPTVKECCVLLCMHMHEHRRLGTALVGDSIQREVMQTAVSFTDYRVHTPGVDEADARRVLKCCIFNALLRYIQQRASHTKRQTMDLENRLRMLRSRLPEGGSRHDSDTREKPIGMQIREIEGHLARIDLHFLTLEDYLRFACGVLSQPSQFISGSLQRLRLDQMGIKVDDPNARGSELEVSQIRIRSEEPKIAALVRFPRKELLPERGFATSSSLFLHG
jgi:hypothetical protein